MNVRSGAQHVWRGMRYDPQAQTRVRGEIIKFAFLLIIVLVAFNSVDLIADERGGGDGASRIELYEMGTSDPSARIVMDVREDFRTESIRGKARTWGVNILTFYPALTSRLDPANVPYVRCSGFCNGRVLISMAYSPSVLLSRRRPSGADVGARGIIENYHTPKYSNVHVNDLRAEAGYDYVFERIVQDTQAADTNATVDRYLIRTRQNASDYDMYAHCRMSTPYHLCQISFSLTCNSAINVDIHGWPHERINESADLKNRVERFVAAMIREPKCE